MRELIKTGIVVVVLIIAGCCKEKKENICKSNPTQIAPFFEKRSVYQCNSTNEYTYILSKKEQIDSLHPTCFFIGSVPFPTDETNMAYVMVGRMSYYLKDTISFTELKKDTCKHILTYEVKMVQRDTALLSNGGGIRSIFCSVENIPPDYQVEVKYRYVPIE
jgi:hypothetical protein